MLNTEGPTRIWFVIKDTILKNQSHIKVRILIKNKVIACVLGLIMIKIKNSLYTFRIF